jgi:hypothetical protein
MQFRILPLLGLFCLSVLLFSCKKDEPDPVQESPFFDFFKENLVNIDTVAQAADSWEYGFAFTPVKSGKVTQFGIKIPATGDYTVTLWDISGASPVVLQTKTVNSSAVHQNAAADIPEVSLKAGSKYGITVRSNAFYRITKPGNAKFIYPRTIGNIRIESFNEEINNSNLAVFPTATNETRVAPCVNVIFIAD